MPSQTTVLEHDIDVGECSPIKQNSYWVNPIKRKIMQEETVYLLEHGFLCQAPVHGAHPVYWSLSQMGNFDSAQIQFNKFSNET